MEKIVNFQKKAPIYCAEDLREYIGYVIENIISDENDCNAQIVLRNTHTNKSVAVSMDKALDGETLFIMHR